LVFEKNDLEHGYIVKRVYKLLTLKENLIYSPFKNII